jgi:hypothetical protein
MLTINPSSTYYDPVAIGAFIDTNYIILFLGAAGQNKGQIQGTSGGVLYSSASDRRLKTNIEIMDPMMDKIMALKPSKYNWKTNNDMDYGFIAQEVHQIFPEFRVRISSCCKNLDEPTDCKTGEPIYYGLDYGRFTPYMVKAFQELKTDYDAKISNLEARLLALEQKTSV